MQRREARERMLDGPLPLDGPFREEIVSSWRRCKLVGVVPTGEDVPVPSRSSSAPTGCCARRGRSSTGWPSR